MTLSKAIQETEDMLSSVDQEAKPILVLIGTNSRTYYDKKRRQ
jgi:hypothetical protein